MKPRVSWNAILLGCAVLALLLLASGLTGLTFQPGLSYKLADGQVVVQAPNGGLLDSAPAQAFFYLLAIVLFVTIVVYLIISTYVQMKNIHFRRRLFVRAGAIVPAMVLLALVIGLLRSLPRGAAEAPAEPGGAQLPLAPLPSFDASPPSWLTLALIAALALLLVAGVWFFWWRQRAQGVPLLAVAETALADIRAGGDVRDTVLRCYRDMSQVLSERRGLERDRAMTPREFAERLAAEGLRDEHIQRLTRLFERVRYGGQRADERDSREAIECLSAIVDAYGAEA